MPVRNIVTAVAIVLAFVAGALFQKMTTPAQAPQQMVQAPEASGSSAMPPAADGSGAPAGESAAATPGLAWNVPARWSDQGARSMRLATYGIPATGGDSEGGECAVFYFGPKQGGGIDENLDRWVGQFEHPRQPQRGSKSYNGFAVKTVEVRGDYLAPSGPMMQSSGTKANWMLLGAIAVGPNGNVFFKLTGPEKTVSNARKEFEDLLGSLRHS